MTTQRSLSLHAIRKTRLPVRREKTLDIHTQTLLPALQKLPLHPDCADCSSDLIPNSMWDQLFALVTISRIGLVAQEAHRIYGVPASFLMAKFMIDHGWFPTEYPKKWLSEIFLKEARFYSGAKFRGAFKFASSPVEYVIALYKRGGMRRDGDPGSGDLYAFDIADKIVYFDLMECDGRYGDGPLFDVSRDPTVEEAAEIVGRSTEFIRCLVESRELAAHKHDAGWLVSAAQLRDCWQRYLLKNWTVEASTSLDNGQPAPAKVIMFRESSGQ